jgi:hypothetical protein
LNLSAAAAAPENLQMVAAVVVAPLARIRAVKMVAHPPEPAAKVAVVAVVDEGLLKQMPPMLERARLAVPAALVDCDLTSTLPAALVVSQAMKTAK